MRNRRRRSQITGTSKSMMLFSLPFAAVGTAIIIWVAQIWIEYEDVKSWDTADGYIEQAEIKRSRSSSSSGSSSTNYKVIASYRYTYQGKEYQSNRVSLHGGASNSGIHHQRYEVIKKWQKKAARAAKRERQPKPFPVLVNPQNPHESVLFHDVSMLMRAGIPFGLVFAMIGYGLFARWCNKCFSTETIPVLVKSITSRASKRTRFSCRWSVTGELQTAHQ